MKFSAQLGELVRRLHFYAGMFVGPFLLVAALSGALYAIAPTLEDITYRSENTVEAVDNPIPLSEQVHAAHEEHPALSVSEVWPADSPTDSTRVLLTDPSLSDANPLAVFVNPGNGDVLGTESSYSGLGELPLRQWISQLHKNLHFGETGEIYTELAASWLWLIAFGGLWLWWRRVKTARIRWDRAGANAKAIATSTAPAGTSKAAATDILDDTAATESPATVENLEPLDTPEARGQGKKPRIWRPMEAKKGTHRAKLNTHAVVGVWLIVAMIGLSIIGITWSRFAGANVSAVAESARWKTDPIGTSLSGDDDAGAHAGHGGHEGHGEFGDHGATGDEPAQPSVHEIASQVEQVVASSHKEGLTGPLRLYAPEEENTAWRSSERWVPWRLTSDQVSINGNNGELVDEIRFSDLSVFSKLTAWGIYLHMGIMFGLPLQILLLISALGIALVVVQGYRMWWQRGRQRNKAKRRRKLPWAAYAVVLVFAVVVGQMLPLLGLSLAALLLLDAILFAMGRRWI